MQYTIQHEGQTYQVQETAEGYKITFPAGYSLTLNTYLDQDQEPAFAFEMLLANALGEEIIRRQNHE